jgi:acyl dehydratase
MRSVNKEQDARELRPLTPIQRAQTREFIRELGHECQTYWDMVDVGDTLSRELHLTPELIILYSDGVEDFNPWYEAWRMNSWQIKGESPFGSAIVPPLLVSHFILSVQFDHTKPFAIGSIHTYHDSKIVAPIKVGATVRITTRAIEKFEKRGRRYVRHEAEVIDVDNGALYFQETRDILSL